MTTPCKSFIPNSLCRDGFPMEFPKSSACTGGKPNGIVPFCQREDIHPRWLNEDGSPRYFYETDKGCSL